MRVAIIQDHLRAGGTERQSLAIARGLAACGHDVSLVVFRRGGALEAEATSDPSFALRHLRQGPLRADWFAPGLLRELRALRADVVIPMGRMANCWAGLLLASPNRPWKLVATLRTGRPIPFLQRRALRLADHVVANSRESLRRLASLHGIDREQKSSVIYNGCLTAPQPKEKSGSSALRLCSVSQFRPQKRQALLLRICARLPQDLDWSLTLAGDGPTRARCIAEARRLGIAERARFPGFIADPSPIYAASDVAVHASDRESLPNFLIEAQYAGLPAVAYDVNGVGETFLDGESGYLIRCDDEDAFLQRILELAKSPDLRRQMSEAARQNAAAKFSLAAQTAAYQDLLSRLAADARTPAANGADQA